MAALIFVEEWRARSDFEPIRDTFGEPFEHLKIGAIKFDCLSFHHLYFALQAITASGVCFSTQLIVASTTAALQAHPVVFFVAQLPQKLLSPFVVRESALIELTLVELALSVATLPSIFHHRSVSIFRALPIE